MDQQAVLARLEDKNRLHLITSLSLNSFTVTKTSAQLCTSTTQSTAISPPPSVDPSRVTVQQVITDKLPTHQIIETVEYNPNIVCIKQEQFESEYPSSQKQHNIVHSIKVEVKEEEQSDGEHGGCVQCAIKRDLDFEGDEQMDTFHYQQVTEDSTNCICPLAHSVPDQLPPHLIIETVEYNPNIVIKEEQFDDDTTLSNHGPPVIEYSTATTLNEDAQHRVGQADETENNFKCAFPGCNKEYKLKWHLTRHTRTHTGEKPYKCTWNGCDKTFSQNSTLRTHRRVHTGEKPLECSWKGCDKTFAHYSTLRTHLRVHTG